MHSHIGPSSAERWVACPGSVKLVAALPPMPGEEADYRVEGTLAHDLLEACLTDGLEAWAVEDQCTDPDMVVALTTSLASIRALIEQVSIAAEGEKPEVFTEVMVSVPWLHPDLFGTLDIGLYWPEFNHVVVIDFKYGAGVWVDAKDNPQVLLYLAGFLEEIRMFSPDVYPSMEGFILQPRMGGGNLRSTGTMTGQDVVQWVQDHLQPAISLAGQQEAPFAAGEHCRWCPAVTCCPVAREYASVVVGNEKDLTPTQIYDGMNRASFLRLYAKRLENEAFSRLMRGVDVPGYKLVLKRVDRQWVPGAEKDLVAALGPRAYTQKLVSPAEVDRLGMKDFTKAFAVTPDGGYTIAPDTDKRPAISRSPATIFERI